MLGFIIFSIIIYTVRGQNTSCIQDGYTYPDVTNCNSYYKCQSGISTKFPCDKGLAWNCFTSTCGLNRYAECCPQDPSAIVMGSKIPCLPNGAKIPNYLNCSSYYQCVNYIFQKKYCGSGERFDVVLMKCRNATLGNCAAKVINSVTTTTVVPTTHSLGPQCPLDKHSLNDNANCSNYYNCSTGASVQQSCGPNLYWNCLDQKCEAKPFPICCMNDSNSLNFSINLNCAINGLKVKNPFYCGLYFICVNNTLQDGICDYGQDFDSINAQCFNTTTGECAASTVAPSSTTPTPTTLSIDICPSNAYTVPDTSNCASYFQCTNGSLVRQTCSGSQYWNCFRNRCELNPYTPCCKNDQQTTQNSSICYLIGRKAPNPMNCFNYYECVNYTIVEKSCPSGLKYDWIKRSCQNGSLAVCEPSMTSSITTTPKPITSFCPLSNTKVANVLNCNSYYACNGSAVSKQFCPTTMYFNCWKQACTTSKSPYCCSAIPPMNKTCTVNGTRTSVPLSCTSYYECVNNTIVKKQCGLGLAFDIWSKTCISPISARCGLKPGLTTCKAALGGNLPFGSISVDVSLKCPKY